MIIMLQVMLFKEANPFIGGWEVSGSEDEIVSDRANIKLAV